MKRNLLKAIALLLLGVFVLTQGAEKNYILDNINDTILYYRTLEKVQVKTPAIYKELERVKALIDRYDNSPEGKQGRMSTFAEIEIAIEDALKQKDEVIANEIEKYAFHNMEMSLEKTKPEEEEEVVSSTIEGEILLASAGTNTGVRKSHTRLSGDVSHYGYGLHGSQTATGGRFDQWAMTAAHKTLPFGSVVRVTNKANGKSVTVRINDRGPYIKGRVLDLSRGAFIKIAPQKQGILKADKVIIEVLKYGNGKRKENR